MSEVAGRMAPLVGAHHLARLDGGRGTLICGVPGVQAAKVVILGAGVAGMAAATLAVGMHANVHILDTNLDRLRQVDHHFRGALETIASSAHAVEAACIDADLVIGAVLVVGARAPKLVSDKLVAQMPAGFRPRRRGGGPRGVLRVDSAHDPFAPHIPRPRIDLLLRREHARCVPPHLYPCACERHAAVRAGRRRPRLAGGCHLGSRAGPRGQRRRGSGGV